ncbi:MAG: hypothetical protein AAFQ41_02115 [Cyanobacteria bacterium J06623_7]
MNPNLLENITAVEVSTVVVDEIVDEVFIPWEAYQGLYYISRLYLDEGAIDLSLWHRYLQLRRQLELAFCLLAIDPSSSQYNRAIEAEVKDDLPVLSQPGVDWENIPSRLPEPIAQSHSLARLKGLLREPQFIKILQQLYQQKLILDRRDRVLRSSSRHDNITDTAYAQTSLQLNGKIVNRYAQKILERSDRHLLLQLHEQSTATGEKQWRGLVEFVLSLVARQSKQ